MTPAEFRALGMLAWGASWQRPMAAALGVSRHTVQSMSSGRIGISDQRATALCDAIDKRAYEFWAATIKLRPPAKTC
jgi:plasmid maintenance system antidote protein VapI